MSSGTKTITAAGGGGGGMGGTGPLQGAAVVGVLGGLILLGIPLSPVGNGTGYTQAGAASLKITVTGHLWTTGVAGVTAVSSATPNGKKVTVLLGECGLEYNLVPCNIARGDQFTDEFLAFSRNNRMPATIRRAGAKPSVCSSPGPAVQRGMAAGPGGALHALRHGREQFGGAGQRGCVSEAAAVPSRMRIDPH